MKTVKKTTNRFQNKFAVAAWLMIALTACKKSNSVDNDNVMKYKRVAEVEIVHGSAGTPALDVAFDDNKLGVNTFNYTDRINYMWVTSGSRKFRVFDATTQSASPIFSKDMTFETGKHYTAFIVDTASKMDVVLIKDSSRAPGVDSARIRFVNLTPDAPALDLYVKGRTEPIATNITYKKAGEFFSYRAALNLVFEIKQAGQSTLLATSNPISLARGKIYSIWSGGYLNGNTNDGTKAIISSFTHKPIYY